MPYIDEESKARLNGPGRGVGLNHSQSAGQLTYDLQQCLCRYLQDKGLSYQILCECLGSLEGAKLDLIARVVKPYEAKKLQENGDVWPRQLLGLPELAPHGGAPL